MAVLMSYHKLIERESKNIDWFWKFGTIFFLLVNVACCLVASYSFHKITEAFDDNCVLNANVDFIKKLGEPLRIDSSASASSSSSNIISRTFNDNQIDEFEIILQKEKEFLVTHEINTKTSDWGSRSKCDWGLHLPIFQCCFGIIIASFFVICGKGGKAEEGSFLVQPWRIVIPSLIFFLVMTFISISYISLVNNGMQKFCDSLTLNTPNVTCNDAMNAFKLVSREVEPNIFYILLYTINWVTFGLWMLLATVMILRMIFVIDFQLVRVTIKTCEYENANEESSFKVIENSKDDLNDSYPLEIKYQEFIQDNVDDENNNDAWKSSNLDVNEYRVR